MVVREADERWFPGYQRIQSLECFHRLAHEDRLLSLTDDLLDGPVLVHPRKIGRVTFPGSEYPTPPHQDFPLIQGTPDVLTIWLPLAECSVQDGALRVLRRSPHAGLRPPQPTPGVGGVGVPVDRARSRTGPAPTTGRGMRSCSIASPCTGHHPTAASDCGSAATSATRWRRPGGGRIAAASLLADGPGLGGPDRRLVDDPVGDEAGRAVHQRNVAALGPARCRRCPARPHEPLAVTRLKRTPRW